MNHDRTYRPASYVPAPRLRDADGSLRQAPRRSAGYAATHPVPPLKGLPGTRTTDVSYRALAPGGAGIGHRICTGASVSRLTAHYSLLTANSTFTFSAKERDSETGLSYFGSRYYSSDLSIWLSVDPMAAKYASLSPYVYCANNPVKLVDPNGEDIWEINNETGKVTRTANTMKDEIRVVNNDGEIIKDDNGKLQSLTYKYGTIKHYTTKKNGYDVFRIRGDDNGTALFELMANNTNVEWTQYKTGIAGEQGLNFVTTAHSSEGNAASANLFNMQLRFGYYIREHIHNHPGTMPVPSGMPNTSQEGTGDIAVASQINKNNENLGYKIPTYKIYTKGYGYQEYNANSRVSDFENIYQLFNMRPAMK